MPKRKFDRWFLLATALLLVVGLLVLYSASSVISFQRFGNTTHYFWAQLLQGALPGLLLGSLAAFLPPDRWRKFLLPLAILGGILLVCVFIPGIGFSSGGARRWIYIGPIFFSPAEPAKVIVVAYLASMVARRPWLLKHFWHGVVPVLSVVVLYAGLILLQPDFGTMSVVLVGAAAVLFAAKLPWKYTFSLLAFASVIGFAFISLEPYRLERLVTFLHPQSDPTGSGYQVNQAALAVGSGGVLGQGYGLSKQKHNYLPEVINDSIFAVAAEELGYLRILLILGLFAFWIWRGLKITLQGSGFSSLLAFGLIAMVGFQAFINIASITGLSPLTGVPLPFFSYGGTSLAITLIMSGLILSSSKHSSAS